MSDGPQSPPANGGGLGNIFDAAGDTTGPRGPDLKVQVDVPRDALGIPDGFAVPVPTAMELDGEPVPRRLGPGESGGFVRLHLPEGFTDGATLRLRGQGGQRDGGSAGDLYVTVRLTDDPLPPALIGDHGTDTIAWWWFALAAALLAGVLSLALAN